MAVEWNALVKPIVYTWELVLCAIVTFGTADQLFFYTSKEARCAFNDSLATCITVVVIGTICLLAGMAILWERLSSAFMGRTFRYDEEALFCLLVSIAYMIMAAVITSNFAIPSDAPRNDLRAMRDVVTAGAWLNFLFYLLSAAIACFTLDTDVDDEAQEYAERVQLRLAESRGFMPSPMSGTADIDAASVSDPSQTSARKPLFGLRETDLRRRSVDSNGVGLSEDGGSSYSIGGSTGTPVSGTGSVNARSSPGAPSSRDRTLPQTPTFPEPQPMSRALASDLDRILNSAQEEAPDRFRLSRQPR